jgi:hypothetical protein
MHPDNQGQQIKSSPWSYTHHISPREIIQNYKFGDAPEGKVGDVPVLEWKKKSAFNEPLPWGGSRTPVTRERTEYEEHVDKHVSPGWSGHLGDMIKNEGYKEDYSNPIHLVEDHPDHGKVIVDGQHRVAVLHHLAPDQKIRVRLSNWAGFQKTSADVLEQVRSKRENIEKDFYANKEDK